MVGRGDDMAWSISLSLPFAIPQTTEMPLHLDRDRGHVLYVLCLVTKLGDVLRVCCCCPGPKSVSAKYG